MQVNLKQKLPTNKPKPCGQPKKIIAIENVIFNASLTSNNTKAIITNFSRRDHLMASKVDTAISATKGGSKIYEPSKYDKAIANFIHSCQ